MLQRSNLVYFKRSGFILHTKFWPFFFSYFTKVTDFFFFFFFTSIKWKWMQRKCRQRSSVSFSFPILWRNKDVLYSCLGVKGWWNSRTPGHRGYESFLDVDRILRERNHWSVPGGSVVKNLPASAEMRVWSLCQEAPPREGHGNPLQCSCLVNLMDRGAWWLQSMGLRVGHDWAQVLNEEERKVDPLNPRLRHSQGLPLLTPLQKNGGTQVNRLSPKLLWAGNLGWKSVYMLLYVISCLFIYWRRTTLS